MSPATALLSLKRLFHDNEVVGNQCCRHLFDFFNLRGLVPELFVKGRKLRSMIQNAYTHHSAAGIAAESFGLLDETPTEPAALLRRVDGQQTEVSAFSPELDIITAGNFSVALGEKEAALLKMLERLGEIDPLAGEKLPLDFECKIDQRHDGRCIGLGCNTVTEFAL